MWHVEGFDATGDAEALSAWLSDHFLPYFRSQGFTVRVFATQAGLGPRQFWLLTEIDGFGDIDDWQARAGEEGARLIRELLSRTTRLTAGVVGEIGAVTGESAAVSTDDDVADDVADTTTEPGTTQKRQRVGHRVRMRPKLN